MSDLYPFSDDELDASGIPDPDDDGSHDVTDEARYWHDQLIFPQDAPAEIEMISWTELGRPDLEDDAPALAEIERSLAEGKPPF